jgi:hypothetical protein
MNSGIALERTAFGELDLPTLPGRNPDLALTKKKVAVSVEVMLKALWN